MASRNAASSPNASGQSTTTTTDSTAALLQELSSYKKQQQQADGNVSQTPLLQHCLAYLQQLQAQADQQLAEQGADETWSSMNMQLHMEDLHVNDVRREH